MRLQGMDFPWIQPLQGMQPGGYSERRWTDRVQACVVAADEQKYRRDPRLRGHVIFISYEVLAAQCRAMSVIGAGD